MKTKVWILLFMIMLSPAMTLGQADAASAECSYSRNIKFKDWAYSISSRRANGCAVQILDISLKPKGKPVIKSRNDVDYLVYNASVSDINSDGLPELLLIGKDSRKPGYNCATLYCIEGNVLKQIPVPPPEDMTGYAGNDDFWVDGSQLVRTFPLMRDGKKVGNRTLKYEMHRNKLSLYVQNDEPLPEPEILSAEPVKTESVETPRSVVKEVYAPSVTDVEVVDNGIMLKIMGPVGKYRVINLDKPERIAVDFIKGKTGLKVNNITIGKFGISRVRVGNNKGFIRFVFDAKDKKFPPHTVKPVADGLLVEFADIKS